VIENEKYKIDKNYNKIMLVPGRHGMRAIDRVTLNFVASHKGLGINKIISKSKLRNEDTNYEPSDLDLDNDFDSLFFYDEDLY